MRRHLAPMAFRYLRVWRVLKGNPAWLRASASWAAVQVRSWAEQLVQAGGDLLAPGKVGGRAGRVVAQAGSALQEKALEYQTDGLGMVAEVSGYPWRTPAFLRQQQHFYPIPLGRQKRGVPSKSLDRLPSRCCQNDSYHA